MTATLFKLHETMSLHKAWRVNLSLNFLLFFFFWLGADSPFTGRLRRRPGPHSPSGRDRHCCLVPTIHFSVPLIYH